MPRKKRPPPVALPADVSGWFELLVGRLPRDELLGLGRKLATDPSSPVAGEFVPAMRLEEVEDVAPQGRRAHGGANVVVTTKAELYDAVRSSLEDVLRQMEQRPQRAGTMPAIGEPRAQAEGAAALTAPWTEDDIDTQEPLVRRLLFYMANRKTALLADVCPAVWGRSAAEVSGAALSTAVSKAKTFLEGLSSPWLLGHSGNKILRQ